MSKSVKIFVWVIGVSLLVNLLVGCMGNGDSDMRVRVEGKEYKVYGSGVGHVREGDRVRVHVYAGTDEVLILEKVVD